MPRANHVASEPSDQISEAIRRYWGFEQLRPLQQEAIESALAARDSLTVLPTGGGKSLCYQVPPVVAERTDIVVSPLISLMKDQVDGLQACGYAAAALHSGMTAVQLEETTRQALNGEYRLLFVSPERLLKPSFLEVARRLNVVSFAIDEAHCISHWGHDFRPEYRQLATLRDRFPEASIHAYTATATTRVQGDIVEQLCLRDPVTLIGTFDRPNLSYRVLPRQDVKEQVEEIIRRHANEAVIVYCLSRKDTENLAATLQAKGINARPYHAGMADKQRRRTQEAFADESLDVVTATVAFGMGIDRSNVRCVVHASIPKSIEHYQQETGRAGRDGLEAECVLLYSAADVMRWESLIAKSNEDVANAEEIIDAQFGMLAQMRRFCIAPRCRHRSLSEYFGQTYAEDDCKACDVCLGDVEGVEDATELSQKILSCVARVNESFGVGHVVNVLAGSKSEQVLRCGHDRLSTYGLLADISPKQLTNYVYQLIDHSLLERTPGDRPILRLNEDSWEVLNGERSVQLMRPKEKPLKKTRAALQSWEGVDQELFEHLRNVRRELAQHGGVPAYVIFGDATLRDLARKQPTTLDEFSGVHGIGTAKRQKFGKHFIAEIKTYLKS